MPKISVIMSTFNRAETFLPAAIKSVLDQTYKDFELIVVDDCSTDNTKEVVESFAEKDNRVLYIPMERNTGSDTKPKNTGILAAQGEFISFVDDDTELFPYHLEVLISKLENNPKLDVVYSDMLIRYASQPEKGLQPAIALDFDAQFLLKRNFIDMSEVLFRKQMAFNVGGFDEKLPKFVDWNLWVRMAKWGAKFERVPVATLKYTAHEASKSARVKTKAWVDPQTGMTMFEPTFNPSGCEIFLPNLGENKAEEMPRVAIFSLTYGRLDYTKRIIKSLQESTAYPFDWFVWDNNSDDGTQEWLKGLEIKNGNVFHMFSEKNLGITGGSNNILDYIKSSPLGNEYQIIIKVDNDCEFMTKHWLEDFINMWKQNHMLYMSPYPEGLVHNPGGGPRIGRGYVGKNMIEVTLHIGGLCAFIDAKAYDHFRWSDQFLHGNQDSEASLTFRKMSYMPCYVSKHRICHMDTTEGQHEKYPQYFERRKEEKTQVWNPKEEEQK